MKIAKMGKYEFVFSDHGSRTRDKSQRLTIARKRRLVNATA
jgi:hypothetical protein